MSRFIASCPNLLHLSFTSIGLSNVQNLDPPDGIHCPPIKTFTWARAGMSLVRLTTFRTLAQWLLSSPGLEQSLTTLNLDIIPREVDYDEWYNPILKGLGRSVEHLYLGLLEMPGPKIPHLSLSSMDSLKTITLRSRSVRPFVIPAAISQISSSIPSFCLLHTITICLPDIDSLRTIPRRVAKSNEDGQYSLVLPPGFQNLRFRYEGNANDKQEVVDEIQKCFLGVSELEGVVEVVF